MLLGTLLLFSYCNNQKRKEPRKDKYNPIEVYCWCFISGKTEFKNGSVQKPGKFCETLIAIRPSDLIRTGQFIYASSDTDEYTALTNLFFNNKISEEPGRYPPDSRFLILLRNKNATNDTIVYRSDDTFIINSKRILKYSFNVMDSVRRILNKDVIDCASGTH